MTITSFNQLDLNRTYSYADYLTWQFTEWIEVLKGKIFPMAAPVEYHQRISWRLGLQMGKYFENQPCRVYAAPFDVRLYNKTKSAQADKDVFTVVQPDLCVICDLTKLDRRGCLGAPDLIVEILSEGNSEKEMNIKYQIYEESGVREYWIVQPENHSVLRFVANEQGVFIGLKPTTISETLQSAIFPELQIELAKVFA
jgi:Uma2 family endonuclease